MRKKLIFFVVVLVILAAVVLVSCNKDEKTEPKPPVDDTEGWKEISNPVMSDVYNRFLGGFTTVATEFSKTKLNRSPKLSAEGKLKLLVNDNPFWATVKMNYDNNSKSDLMLSFELSTKEDSYEDNVLGLFVYKEKAYLAIGQTKFSMNLTADNWSSFFPFDMAVDIDTSKLALVLSSILVNKTDPVGKTRMNGINEEFNYVVSIDLPASLKNLFGYISDTDFDLDIGDIAAYETIITNLFGVTFEDILEGNFPQSSLTLDFTTSNMRISTLSASLDVDTISSGNQSIFGDRLSLDVGLQNFEISKQKNVSIPFVNNDYADERENYVYYAENAFRINVNSEKTVSGTAVPYEVVITAKVLQEESINNYLFVEYKNKSTGKLDKGFYVYKDIAYFYELKENEYVCTLSMPLDISELTNRVLANDFGTEKNFNWMDAISYIIGALQVTTENIIFRYDSEFYNSVWFNAIDMLNYIDGHYNEDLQSMEEISSLIDFIKLPSVLTFSYHVPFLNIVEDQDSALSDTIGMLLASEPLLTLTPASQDTSNNDGTEDEVTENEGQEENMLVA